jgi:hypothetical protein
MSVVYHLGGMVGNGQSMIDVRRYVDVNSVGTATLLEQALARRSQIRRLVVASSMVVYGDGAYRCVEHGELPSAERPLSRLAARQWEPVCPTCERVVEPIAISESRPLRPNSVYGICKRDQEELCLVVGRAHRLSTVALRYLCTYGSRQALGNPYTGVAAIWASRLLNGRRPVVFEDGAQRRDFVHVSDVVAARRGCRHACSRRCAGRGRLSSVQRRLRSSAHHRSAGSPPLPGSGKHADALPVRRTPRGRHPPLLCGHCACQAHPGVATADRTRGGGGRTRSMGGRGAATRRCFGHRKRGAARSRGDSLKPWPS